MRTKRRRPRSTNDPSMAVPGHVDLGASARQVGLFETANGVPHGLGAIVIAFGAALLLVPVRTLWQAVRGRGGRRS